MCCQKDTRILMRNRFQETQFSETVETIYLDIALFLVFAFLRNSEDSKSDNFKKLSALARILSSFLSFVD